MQRKFFTFHSATERIIAHDMERSCDIIDFSDKKYVKFLGDCEPKQPTLGFGPRHTF